MMKSKFKLLAILTLFLIGISLIISFVIRKMDKGEGAGHYSSSDEETDYLEDLDAPELPEKEERSFSKTRRGYIPVRLGRD